MKNGWVRPPINWVRSGGRVRPWRRIICQEWPAIRSSAALLDAALLRETLRRARVALRRFVPQGHFSHGKPREKWWRRRELNAPAAHKPSFRGRCFTCLWRASTSDTVYPTILFLFLISRTSHAPARLRGPQNARCGLSRIRQGFVHPL
jgi:hypothetical protein